MTFVLYPDLVSKVKYKGYIYIVTQDLGYYHFEQLSTA